MTLIHTVRDPTEVVLARTARAYPEAAENVLLMKLVTDQGWHHLSGPELNAITTKIANETGAPWNELNKIVRQVILVIGSGGLDKPRSVQETRSTQKTQQKRKRVRARVKDGLISKKDWKQILALRWYKYGRRFLEEMEQYHEPVAGCRFFTSGSGISNINRRFRTLNMPFRVVATKRGKHFRDCVYQVRRKLSN